MNENILLVDHIQRLEETLALVNQKLERSGGSGSGRSSSTRADNSAPVIETTAAEEGGIEEGQNYDRSRESSGKGKVVGHNRESIETISSYKSAQSDHTPIPHSDQSIDLPIITEAKHSSKDVANGHNSDASAAAAVAEVSAHVIDEKTKGHNYEESEEDVDDDGDVWHTAEAFGSTLVLEEEEEY